jgi:anti-sigma regulatory factor (Ser/Thr protein kinase)
MYLDEVLMHQISLTLKNDIAEIERLSQSLEVFGRSHQLPEDFLYAVNLALEEILTNTISYGYADAAEHEITVELRLQQGELTAEIADDARPFNPLAAPEADVNSPLAERRVGGLGIHLVRKFMDAVEYRRERDKNLLIMKKRLAS